jgi:hypothetical protein
MAGMPGFSNWPEAGTRRSRLGNFDGAHRLSEKTAGLRKKQMHFDR